MQSLPGRAVPSSDTLSSSWWLFFRFSKFLAPQILSQAPSSHCLPKSTFHHLLHGQLYTVHAFALSGGLVQVILLGKNVCQEDTFKFNTH